MLRSQLSSAPRLCFFARQHLEKRGGERRDGGADVLAGDSIHALDHIHCLSQVDRRNRRISLPKKRPYLGEGRLSCKERDERVGIEQCGQGLP